MAHGTIYNNAHYICIYIHINDDKHDKSRNGDLPIYKR